MSDIEKYFYKFGSTTETIDLNTVREQGFYFSKSASNKFLNKPEGALGTFLLEVSVIEPSELNPNGFVRQVLSDSSSQKEYHRMYSGVSDTLWSAWSEGTTIHAPHIPRE